MNNRELFFTSRVKNLVYNAKYAILNFSGDTTRGNHSTQSRSIYPREKIHF